MDDTIDRFKAAKRLGIAAAISLVLLAAVPWRIAGWMIVLVILLAVLKPQWRAALSDVLGTTRRYLRPCRFSLLAVILGAAVFTVAGQGAEGLRAIGEGVLTGRVWPLAHALGFLIAVSLWGVTIWYWARVSYSLDELRVMANGDRLGAFYQREMPRILGAGAFAAIMLGFIKIAIEAADRASSNLVVVLLILGLLTGLLGVLFYWLTYVRRKFINNPPKTKLVRFLFVGLKSSGAELHKNTKWALTFSGLVSFCFLVACSIVPVSIGDFLGADITILCALALWVPGLAALSLPLRGGAGDDNGWRRFWSFVFLLAVVGGAAFDRYGGDFIGTWPQVWTIVLLVLIAAVYVRLVFFSPLLDKAPIISIALIGALFFSFWNDNHAVRPAIKDGAPILANQRDTVEQAFDYWRDDGHCDKDKGCPLVVVATAGGGLRAALWTTTVLGRIQDSYEGFADRLFAISGVSGGALGATVYRALIAKKASREGLRCGTEKTLEACAQRILGRDFLGPAIASMFFPEAVQRFLPFTTEALMYDRAAALERSWEDGWRRTVDGAGHRNILAQPFLDMWDRRRPWPALFLNGAVVESARRIIVSNLCVADGQRAGRPVFREAHDFFFRIKHDVPVSTAANVAARFPYVEPAGTIRYADYRRGEKLIADPECGLKNIDGIKVKQGADWRRFVDGGYFENFGVATAIDVLNELRKKRWDSGVRPIVIMISSDPDFSGPPSDLGAKSSNGKEPKPDPCLAPTTDAPQARQWAGEMMSPPAAYLSLRGAIGCSAAWRLRSWVAAMAPDRGRFFHFRLSPSPGRSEPALGWLLSAGSLDEIKSRLCGDDQNKAAIEGLLAELSGKPNRGAC